MRSMFAGLLLSMLLLTGAVCGAEQVTLPADTPIFAAPDHQSKILFVVRQELTVKKTGDFMQLVKVHPLAMYFNFFRLEFPNGAKGYLEPAAFLDVRAANDYSVGVRPVALSWPRYICGMLPWLGLLLLLAEFLHRRQEKRSYERMALIWRMALIPVLLRQGLLLLVVNGAGNIIASPADDIGYFSNALSFLNGDFSQPWHFTVGQSILYLPFIRLTGATDVKDIVVPFSWFCGLVLAPATLAAGFLIGVKLTSRRLASLAAMALWAVLPFFYHHQPDFVTDIFRSFWDVPSLRMTFQHYTNLIGTGFNAMSDTPSTLVMLLCILWALHLRGKWYEFAGLGGLFAFGCMLRINNILFVPLLAFIVLNGVAGFWRDWRRTLLPGVAGFLLVFMPQFAVNWYFYGNPLQFSYTRYAAGAHTYFSWKFFPVTAAWFGAANHLVWISGIVGLLWCRKFFLRMTFILWSVPIILFFCGYSHGTDDPIRFIMTSIPALLLAGAVAIGGDRRINLTDALWLAGVAVMWIAVPPVISLGCPELYLGYKFWRPLYSWYPAIFCLIILCLAVYFRKDDRLRWLLLLASLLFWFGNGYVLVTLLTLLMFETLILSVGRMRKKMSGFLIFER